MATLRQYFDTDFIRVLGVHQTWQAQASGGRVPVIARLHLDFDANAKFASCYIPKAQGLNPTQACRAVIDKCEDLEIIGSGVHVQAGLINSGERTSSQELRFTGRVFIYSEADISEVDRRDLVDVASERGLALIVRGPQYAMAKSKLERPLAFISHDFRDKDAVARPIAIGLSKLICPVWFDEYSLQVGDSLRESIEKGLKESKRCIVILSPRFLSNPGWTKVEFNSIFTREIIERQNLVLPVWHDVTKEEVFNYCPSLLDRLGVNWSLGEEEVVRRLYRAISA